MPHPSRKKGDRFERECVNALKDAGISAERVPLSGAAGGKFLSDICAEIPALSEEEWRIECKKRAAGFTKLYDWIAGNKALFISADRAETLVVMRMVDFTRLARVDQ